MTEPTDTRMAPLDPGAWGLTSPDHERTEFLGRPCIRFGDTDMAAALPDVVLEDGVIEVDLAVSRERSFHGPIWRVRDPEDFESLLRPPAPGR